MNTKLLNKVANAILDEPRKFDMRWWFLPSRKSPCGTTACIAGWAISLSEKWKGKPLKEARKEYAKLSERTLIDEADELLGVSGGDQECRIYGYTYWPKDFAEAYISTQNPFELAEITFWRIQHFIATEGRE